MEEHTVSVKLRRGVNLDIVLLDLGDGQSFVLQGDLKAWAEARMPPPKIDLADIEAWRKNLADKAAAAWVDELLEVVRRGYHFQTACRERGGKDSPHGKKTFIEWCRSIERFKDPGWTL